jgi:dTMP kinase
MNYHVEFDLSFTTNRYPGKYYAFEGIDGSGKTTQVQKLAEYFLLQNREVVITKEPSSADGVVGELIHKILNKEITVPSMTLQYLFAADRALHLDEIVIPALKADKIVISDRSFWSAVAYGIADLQLPENEQERMLVAHNVLALYGGYLVPDKTFVIDVPAYIAMQRVVERKKEQTIYERVETLDKVAKEYEWMAEKFSDVLKIINGTQSVEEVFKAITANL